MRTRGLRFISRGTRVAALPKKKKKKRRRRKKRLQPWLSADFRNYRVESRGLSGSTRGRVSYRAPEASEHTMESRVYRVTTMIRVPLRFK